MRFLVFFPCCLLVCLVAFGAFAGNAEFAPPLKGPLTVTGTFAEKRGDHFHSGIDFSTGAVTGKSVFAVKDGTVSRIKVSQSGFGKALYLQHADGTFTVYAHLEAFVPEIEDYVLTRQRKKQSYEVDLYPGKKFAFEKGGLVGFSGNSGVKAPHLHFELRNSVHQPQNPFNQLGLELAQGPVFRHFAVYPLSEHSTVNGQRKPVFIEPELKNGKWTLGADISFSGYVGIGVDVIQINSGNRLGVERVELVCGPKPLYAVEFDSFDYKQYRRVENFYDRSAYLNSKWPVLMMFAPDGAKPGFFVEKDLANGIISSVAGNGAKVLDGKTRVTVNASGFDSLGISCVFNLVPEDGCAQEPLFDFVVPAGSSTKTHDGRFLFSVPEGGRVYDFNLPGIEVLENDPQETSELWFVSSVCRVKPESGMFPSGKLEYVLPDGASQPGNMSFFKRKAPGQWSFVSRAVRDRRTFSCTVSTGGDYVLAKDQDPPRVVDVSASAGKVEFEVDDSVSGLDAGRTVLFVDGKMCFAYFNRKTNRFLWRFKTPLVPGQHNLEIRTFDLSGNRAVSKRSFTV